MMGARRRGIHLREFAEDEIVMLARDSHTRIAHLDQQRRIAVVVRERRAYPYASKRRCEFDGVAKQVTDHVRNLFAIGEELRHVRLHAHVERELLLLEQRRIQGADLIEDVANVEARRDEVELIGGGAGVRQNLTDLIQQLTAAANDAPDTVHLPRREITEDAVSQDFRVRDHRRERRSEIVRDVGEELCLERVTRAQLGDLDHRLFELRL